MTDDLDRTRDARRARQLFLAISAVMWVGVGVYVWRSDALPAAILGLGIVQLVVGGLDLAARNSRPLARVTASPRAAGRAAGPPRAAGPGRGPGPRAS